MLVVVRLQMTFTRLLFWLKMMVLLFAYLQVILAVGILLNGQSIMTELPISTEIFFSAGIRVKTIKKNNRMGDHQHYSQKILRLPALSTLHAVEITAPMPNFEPSATH